MATRPGSSFRGQKRGLSTAAGELLVQADLARRGFEVTVPVSHTARHDLHADFPSCGWKGVQIKVGRLTPSTGRLTPTGRNHKKIESPILAVVFPPNGRIDYRAGTEPLPDELK